MKRKASAALVLALVLVLVTCAAALALTTWREELDGLLHLQSDEGYYDAWDLEAKLQLLALMEKNGVDMGENFLSIARDETKTSQARAAAADEIIARRYGVDDRIDTVTVLGIMETELGAEFWDWSVEDMAWYSRTELQFRNASPDEEVFTLPRPGDLTQEQALEKAKAALKQYRQVNVDQTPFAKTRVQFVVYPYMGAPLDEPEWRFTWLAGNGSSEAVGLSAQGQVNWVQGCDELIPPDEIWHEAMEARKAELLERVGPDTQWSLADWAYYRPEYYRVPTPEDIAPERAEAIARDALLADNILTPEEMTARTPSLSLRLTHVTPAGKRQYIYVVRFTPVGSDDAWDCYVNVYSDSGEVQRVHRNSL